MACHLSAHVPALFWMCQGYLPEIDLKGEGFLLSSVQDAKAGTYNTVLVHSAFSVSRGASRGLLYNAGLPELGLSD